MRSNKFVPSLAFVLLLASTSFRVLLSQQPSPPYGPPASQSPQMPLIFDAPAKHAEDWSNIALDPNAMQAMSYAVIGKAETPDFTRELLRIQWRVADPIDLYVIRPHGVAHPRAILYLYGYPSETDRFMNDGWCKRATKDGFAAVGFVSALTGPRFSNRPMKEWFVSELQESLGTTTHDVQMVLNYLARRDDIDSKKVGMFGQGSGGTIALLAAAADPRIQVVDVVDPWGDWPDWFKTSAQVPDVERPNFVTPEFQHRIETLEPLRYLPNLKLKALRVQQVMTDPVTPSAAKDKISAAVPKSAESVRYENEKAQLAGWRLTGLSGWIEQHMQPPSAAAPRSD